MFLPEEREDKARELEAKLEYRGWTGKHPTLGPPRYIPQRQAGYIVAEYTVDGGKMTTHWTLKIGQWVLRQVNMLGGTDQKSKKKAYTYDRR